MKYLVFVIFVTCAVLVHSSPLDRVGSKVAVNDVDKESIEKLLKELKGKLDGVSKQDIIDWIFPPMVSFRDTFRPAE